MVTRADIERRMNELNQNRLMARAEAEDATARVHAYAGAMQDCEYWLSQMPNGPIEVVPPPPSHPQEDDA